MAYALVSTSNFERGLRRLSSSDLDRAQDVVRGIVEDPYSFKELRGKFRHLRSARFGAHRVIYTVSEARHEVVLLAVEPRGSAYGR